MCKECKAKKKKENKATQSKIKPLFAEGLFYSYSLFKTTAGTNLLLGYDVR